MNIARLRLVTLNCLYHHRPRARLRVIGRMLKEMASDVVCLQEIIFKRNVSLLADDRAIFRPWGFVVLGGLVTLAGGVDGWRFEPFRTTVWFERGARKGFLNEPVVVAGDFNVPADAPQFKAFMNRCGLQSAMDWSAAASSRDLRGIDNILFRPPAGRRLAGRATLCFQDQVQLPQGRSVYPSDHEGLVAELDW